VSSEALVRTDDQFGSVRKLRVDAVVVRNDDFTIDGMGARAALYAFVGSNAFVMALDLPRPASTSR